MGSTGWKGSRPVRRAAWCAAVLAALVGAAAARILAGEPDATPASRPKGSTARGAATGGVSGRVMLGPKLSTRQVRFHLYPDEVAVAADTKRRPAAPPSELRNVVVYVETAPAGQAPQAPAPA